MSKRSKKLLSNLKRDHRTLFDKLDKDLRSRYLNKKEAVFSVVKPSESGKTLDHSLFKIFNSPVERFASIDKVSEMNSFKLLARLFKEQCTEDNKESDRKSVQAKPNKDIASDFLQNPFDSDAGYCGHKGKGY